MLEEEEEIKLRKKNSERIQEIKSDLLKNLKKKTCCKNKYIVLKRVK